MERRALLDRSTFWLTFAGVGGVIAGALIAIGLVAKDPGTSVWSTGWFIAGVVVFGVVICLLNVALILYFAHGHAQKHMCPDPSAHPPAWFSGREETSEPPPPPPEAEDQSSGVAEPR